MPYTNTQHPSNTRTTVTIVLSIIFGISIIPTTAIGEKPQTHKSLIFTLENADYPTIYQEVKVKIQRGDASADNGFPDTDTFDDADEVYFIKTRSVQAGGPIPCEASPKASKDVILRRVTVATDKTHAMATVFINKPEFEVDQTYKICYIKKGTVTPGSDSAPSKVYEALYLVSSANTAPATFTVHNSIFTTPVTKPETIYAGQETVTLSITVADRVKASLSLPSVQENQRLYLIPCTNNDCLKDNIAPLCSSKDGVVATAVVAGFGTGPLITTFNAPANPTSPYRICVPYCFKTASCTSQLISWALVNSEPITFQPANPSVYALIPTTPQARSWTKITFTGTDLGNGDKIRIVAQGEKCTSTAELLPNIEYTEVTPVSDSTTSTVFKFRMNKNGVLATAVTGKVCYSLTANPDVWAPVYKTKEETAIDLAQIPEKAGDLVISPFHPTGFSIVSKSLEIGQVLQVAFTGTGLHAEDTSYLMKCATPDSLDFCEGIASTTTKIKYECKITENGDASAICNVNINPDVPNGEGMQLCACYKKNGHTDYALVAGSVTVYPKSPTYTITPYPFTVGGKAKLKFTGTDLSATDSVKIISEGADCNTAGTLQTGVITIRKDVNVNGAAEVTYTISGTASGCFTICYRRKTIWTVSTNSDSSTIIPTPTCKTDSSLFLSPNTSPLVLPQTDVSANGDGNDGPPAQTPGAAPVVITTGETTTETTGTGRTPVVITDATGRVPEGSPPQTGGRERK